MGNAPLNTELGISQVLPLLVVPVAFCSALQLIHHSLKYSRFQETFSLLFVALNTVFMWFCLGYNWLYFPIMELNSTDFKDQIIITVLHGAINIEPVNIFMYIWRFLETLENEQSGKRLTALHWFRVVSIWVVPLVYIGLGLTLMTYNSQSAVAYFEGNSDLATHYSDLEGRVYRVLGYWSTITNLIACAIMFLVIQHVRKITH
jgi:hypothetical protein